MGAAAATAWRRTEEPGSGELEWRASACSSVLAVAAALRGACAAPLWSTVCGWGGWQAGWDWEGELGFRHLAIGLWPFGLAAGRWALGLSLVWPQLASRLGSARRFSEPRKEARLGSF